MKIDQSEFVQWFRQASPYIHAHGGKTCVITFPGEAAETPGFAKIIHDIALLHSLGLKIVIVHGARKQIDDRLKLRKTQSKFVDGCRVTDSETLISVQDAAGSVRIEVEAQLSMGLINSPMHGARIKVCSGNFVTAKPKGIINGVDFQHSGEVRSVDVQGINRQLSDDSIVVISPLGYSTTGEVFNLMSENLAQSVAVALSADKLICLSEQAELANKEGKPTRELTPALLDQLNVDHLPACTQRHLQACIEAAQAKVPRCHLISYQNDGALLQELFTRDGGGTLVTTETYEQVHIASIDDVGGILELIGPLEDTGVLVKRSRELLETEIEQFTVIERDGMIVACAALYPFAEEKVGELACVAVHPDYRDGARGNILLEHIEKHAKSLGLESLFVLTTQATHWFVERGFQPKSLNDLPKEKVNLYNYQRSSKVFFKIIP